MSHNVAISPAEGQPRLTNLPCLARAAERLGLEFKWGQTTYECYYTQRNGLVGDYPVPEGFAEEDMGKCLHAIVNPAKADAKGNARYEIGISKLPSQKEEYTFLYDFWGNALEPIIGEKGCKLLQAYNIEVAIEQATLCDGNYDLMECTENPGEYVMTIDTTVRVGQ